MRLPDIPSADASPAAIREALNKTRALLVATRSDYDDGADMNVMRASDQRLMVNASAQLATLEEMLAEATPEARDMNGKTFGLHPSAGSGRRPRDRRGAGGGESLGAQWIEHAKTLGLLDGTSGGTMVTPWYDSAARDLPQRQPLLRDIIPTTMVPSGDAVNYVRQTVATQAAAPVAVGAVKPGSTYTYERISAPFSVIAHKTEPLDTSLMSDYPALERLIDGQMRLGILLAEETQILSGNGTPPNLRGILNTAGIQTQAKGADPVPDAIFKGMNLIRKNGFREPNAVVIHPDDWVDIALLRTADGPYIFGDPSAATQPQLWGKPVYVTPAISVNTALVGYFEDAHLWVRLDAMLKVAYSGVFAGNEIFERNQLVALAEERVAFGVERPLSFATVTGI